MAHIIASMIFSVNDMKDGVAQAWIAEQDPEGRYSTLKTNIGSGSVLITIVDDMTISRPHRYKWIDEGLVFRQAYKYDIEIDGVGYMLIKCGTKYPHTLLKAMADGDVEAEVFHSPTVTLDGDEEPSGNFNFNSSNTSLTTWFPNPTIGDDGSYIAMTWIFGGSGAGTPAGSEGAGTMTDFDVVLIPNVEFLIKFTNHAGRAIQILFESIYVEWEHDYS